MQGSHYRVLDVASSASEAEIRARYLILMRRYHPDVNRSPTSHGRALQISEAFRVLTDPVLRAQHDAELARQRVDAVSARAVNLSRISNRRALVVRRRHPGLRRYGPGLALVLLLVVTAIAAWHIEARLGRGESATFVAREREADTEVQTTIAALKAATEREAQAMPPVSDATVAGGVHAFRRIAAAGDLSRARAFSQRCYVEAADADTWDALDFCVAFDQAAFARSGAGGADASGSDGYFMDRHDRAAHLYIARHSNMDAILARLATIRDQVVPGQDRPLNARTVEALHGIAEGGRKIAEAARSIFDPDEIEPLDVVGNARDF